MADPIPIDRRVAWTPGVTVGVEGGIAQYLPGGVNERTSIINVTQAPYNADNTGATDASGAINDAIVAATAGDVVYLPAGTYKLDDQISVSHSRDNITIRGDGPTTILAPAASAASAITAGNSGWNWPPGGANVTSDLNKGDTSIPLDDASQFSAGYIIILEWDQLTDNSEITAGEFFSFNVGGLPRSVRQIVKVISKAGDTLTVFPGINHQPPAGLACVAFTAQLQLEKFGMENFSVDLSDNLAVFPISIGQALNSWVYNVTLQNAKNYHLTITDSLFCEVRRCDLRDRLPPIINSNGGALLVLTCSGLWVEDNIMSNVFPCMEVNASTTGSAFTYNLFESHQNGLGTATLAIDANHGPWNHFNLYEGNVAGSFDSDGYFGGSSYDTVHRNWLTSTTYLGLGATNAFALHRFARNYNIVGNVMGTDGVINGNMSFGNPNIGNGSSTGTAQPSLGVFWDDWKMTGTLTTRTSDTVATVTFASGSVYDGQYITLRWSGGAASGNVSSPSGSTFIFTAIAFQDVLPAAATSLNIFTQAGGYQELDLDVEATSIEKGNYLYDTDGAPGSMSSLDGDTLATSYIHSSKPSFFGDLPWPPFDPTSPDSSSYENIPAAYRFVNGENPPGTTNSLTCETLNVTTMTLG